MKTKELMINDIVGSRFHAQPMRYSGIFMNYEPLNEKPYTRLRLMLNENEGLDVPECDVVPIPLTKDFFVANGWKKNGVSYKYCVLKNKYYFIDYNFDKHHLRIRTYPGYEDLDLFLSVHYVHELQRVFRLCGLNELADNLKIEEVKK